MKNQYQILKDRQHKEFNAFPLGAAFSQTQFTEMMAKWGLEPTDTDKILHVGAGCYIRKTDREAFHALVERLEKEKQDAIAADTTGEGFIKDMFKEMKSKGLKFSRKELEARFMNEFDDSFEDEE